jgi:hypothetical protein
MTESTFPQPAPRLRLRVSWPAAAALAALALLGAAGWIVARGSADTALLNQAASDLRDGRSEAALAALHRLPHPRWMSVEARTRAASIYFLLGEDVRAHRTLGGLPFRAGHPQDARLRELSGHCLNASRLLQRADRSQDPAKRVALARQAYAELPHAPAVLERLVEEELLAVSRGAGPEVESALLRDYGTLRRSAPTRAAAVKRKLSETLTGAGGAAGA